MSDSTKRVQKMTDYTRTLSDQIKPILGQPIPATPPSGWPPDIYAITAAIVLATGCYLRWVNKGPANVRELRIVARLWREKLNSRLQRVEAGDFSLLSELPQKIGELWMVIYENRLEDLENLKASDAFVNAAMDIITVCDECSVGIGIRTDSSDEFTRYATFLLSSSDQRTLTSNTGIEPHSLYVLPKQHTPQRGLSLRSLTHHLALLPHSEVPTKWSSPLPLPDKWVPSGILNILLLPWPEEICRGDFRCDDSDDNMLPGNFSFFSYHRATDDDFPMRLRLAISEAEKKVAQLHAVIFPELSLTKDEYAEAAKVAAEKGLILIAGVVEPGDHRGWGANVCYLNMSGYVSNSDSGKFPEFRDKLRRHANRDSPAGETMAPNAELNHEIRQSKHHRWCLTRDQIMQYGLGSRIPASKSCWERIELGDREINFVTLGSWITWCVLICEDLARQEPVAETLRSVGPNLVVALLMDGPQLPSRWAARCASTLVEDPGCSVLTLTSLAMSKISEPRFDRLTEVDRENLEANSRTIGYWKDVKYGERPVSLDKASDNCAILSVVCRSTEEFTYDGRGDGRTAFIPTFAGLRSYRVQI